MPLCRVAGFQTAAAHSFGEICMLVITTIETTLVAILSCGSYRAARSSPANLAAFTVNLDDQDRALIAGLSKRERPVSPDFAPVWDAFDR